MKNPMGGAEGELKCHIEAEPVSSERGVRTLFQRSLWALRAPERVLGHEGAGSSGPAKHGASRLHRAVLQ